MEATEPPEIALKYYTELLEADPTNAVCVAAVTPYVVFSYSFCKRIWKRRISVFRRTGKIDKAVQELSQYLDTFYADVEGWLELADIYATCSQYALIFS